MISGTGSTLFEELGLYYIGPVDGHNMDDLVAVLSGTRGLYTDIDSCCMQTSLVLPARGSQHRTLTAWHGPPVSTSVASR
jgi:hypothetical protein